jgi:hypothetical protein
VPALDTLAEILEASLAVEAAERDLGLLDLDDPGRPEGAAAAERALERYRLAVQEQERVRRARERLEAGPVSRQ